MKLAQRLARALLEDHPTEAARALERMPTDHRAAAVGAAPREAARALAETMPAAVAECLSRLDPPDAASVLEALHVNAAIAALRRLPPDVVGRFVARLPSEKQETMQRVLRHAPDTAAALMDPEVFALPDDISVAEARARLRREPRGLLHYLYVVSRSRRLVGAVDISELMRARLRDPIGSVMHEPVEHVPVWTPTAAVRSHPGWRSFHTLPVTDEAGALVGALRYQTLRRLEQEAESRADAQAATVTAGALGELFQLGVAGLMEGVAGAAAPQSPRSTRTRTGEEGKR